MSRKNYNSHNLLFLLLALLSAVLMSLPFLVPGTGFFALFGFVPLLIMDALADSYGVRKFFWWYYLSFVFWNAFTTFWVCNATVGGGIFAVLANAFQMAVIFAVFRLSKKRFPALLSYIFLAVMWIAWERFYFDAQISWPWLVLGNAFARSTNCIQWYEYTGSLGGSAWIWVSNISIFYLFMEIVSGNDGRGQWVKKTILVLVCASIVAVPLIISNRILDAYEETSEGSLQVGIVQPNFDPYEKFESLTQSQQNAIFDDLSRKLLADYVDDGAPYLLIGPETFTSDIIIDCHEASPTWQRFVSLTSEYPNTNLLFGASTYEFFPDKETAPKYTARALKNGSYVQSRNSAIMLDGTGRTEIFHKSKLVVGTELTPFPALFTRIDDLLGGVMGRCIGQDEISLLNCVSYDTTGIRSAVIPIGCAVCYESVYGEYCTGYVRAGAKAMAVITNDAWWGNTPGYKQHLSYACLRAIELRRDIARCGNTGISAFINQKGEIVSRGPWWERATLSGRVNLNDKLTFYARHGDIPGKTCTWIFLGLMSVLLILFIKPKK